MNRVYTAGSKLTTPTSIFLLNTSKKLVVAPGAQVVTLDWPPGTVSGDVGFRFNLSQHLALAGIILASFSLRGETVDLILNNLTNYEIALSESTPVAVVESFEPVQLVPSATIIGSVLSMDKPAPKPKRKRKA